MKLREHRSTLIASLETVIEMPATIDALADEINKQLNEFCGPIKKEDIHVKAYGFDSRIDWETYIVTIDGYGVYGFTDGPLNEVLQF